LFPSAQNDSTAMLTALTSLLAADPVLAQVVSPA
jgi:hypothetical protein